MYLYIILLDVLLGLTIWILSNINWRAFKLNFFNRRIFNINGLFKSNFIDSQVLFAAKFNVLGNISFIKHIDTSKAYTLIMENFGNEIKAVHQYNTFDYTENKALFNVTIFVLKNERIVEIGYDYAEIFYSDKHYNWANALLTDLANCKVDRTKVIGFARSEVMN